METRRHCLFPVSSEWICFFILTSSLSGTDAEVTCIPSCQLPPIEAASREASLLELAEFSAAPAEELFPSQEEKPSAAEPREESSFKVQQENKTTGPRDLKLSHPPQSAPDPAPSNVTDGRSADGRNNSFSFQSGDASSWRRARSAETWSGFGTEGGGEDPDREELRLTSSTFALAGDTAHNQAMVHWSGQNSSVSSRRARHFYARGVVLTQCGQRALLSVVRPVSSF